MNFIKNFIDWFKLKPELDKNKHNPFFREREVWWTHLGSNIGFEIDGKTSQLTRPVLILKKISHQTALVLPLSTKIKQGTWYHQVLIDQKEAVIILAQSRTIDSKRLKTRIETMGKLEFETIKQKFIDFIQT
jgi:mRNA-degrading endonuclease toxin of MazEF toxin-antitoxin module